MRVPVRVRVRVWVWVQVCLLLRDDRGRASRGNRTGTGTRRRRPGWRRHRSTRFCRRTWSISGTDSIGASSTGRSCPSSASCACTWRRSTRGWSTSGRRIGARGSPRRRLRTSGNRHRGLARRRRRPPVPPPPGSVRRRPGRSLRQPPLPSGTRVFCRRRCPSFRWIDVRAHPGAEAGGGARGGVGETPGDDGTWGCRDGASDTPRMPVLPPAPSPVPGIPDLPGAPGRVSSRDSVRGGRRDARARPGCASRRASLDRPGDHPRRHSRVSALRRRSRGSLVRRSRRVVGRVPTSLRPRAVLPVQRVRRRALPRDDAQRRASPGDGVPRACGTRGAGGVERLPERDPRRRRRRRNPRD